MQVCDLGTVMGQVMSDAGTPVTYHQHGVMLTLVAVDYPAQRRNVCQKRHRRASILHTTTSVNRRVWDLDVRQTNTYTNSMQHSA